MSTLRPTSNLETAEVGRLVRLKLISTTNGRSNIEYTYQVTTKRSLKNCRLVIEEEDIIEEGENQDPNVFIFNSRQITSAEQITADPDNSDSERL